MATIGANTSAGAGAEVRLNSHIIISRSRLERVFATYSATLLAVLAMALMNSLFVMAIVRYRYEPRLVILYLAFINFYAALYFRRRLLRHRHGVLLRRGLGYSAIFLGAFLLALFFYSFAQVGITTLSHGAGVGLVIAVAAYFFYRVIVLHLEDDEEQKMQVEIRPRPPI